MQLGNSVRLAEHASDAIGNLPVIQSFTRVQAELQALRSISQQFFDTQLPVLTFWAMTSIATRAAATLTVSAILIVGAWLVLHQQLTLGELVTFISLATMLIGRLDATVTFVRSVFQESLPRDAGRQNGVRQTAIDVDRKRSRSSTP